MARNRFTTIVATRKAWQAERRGHFHRSASNNTPSLLETPSVIKERRHLYKMDGCALVQQGWCSGATCRVAIVLEMITSEPLLELPEPGVGGRSGGQTLDL